TDDPVHGAQTLSAYHGYYRQHQYFPLLVYDGASGFPLAAWLRPGTVHASCGAAAVLAEIVAALRAAWPGVTITVRGDSGLAVPAVYDFLRGPRPVVRARLRDQRRAGAGHGPGPRRCRGVLRPGRGG